MQDSNLQNFGILSKTFLMIPRSSISEIICLIYFYPKNKKQSKIGYVECLSNFIFF